MTEQQVVQALLVFIPLLPIVVWRTGSDWTHPIAFCAVYVGFVCLAPFYYVVATGRPLGVFTPDLATRESFTALYLFSAAFAVGCLVGKRRPLHMDEGPFNDDSVAESRKPHYLDWSLLRRTARTTLIMATAIRAIETVGPRGTYGADQLDFTAMTAVGTAVDLVVLPAVVALVMANKNLNVHGPLLKYQEIGLLLVFAIASLYVGSRSPLLAPILFLAFAFHRWQRPIRVWVGLPAAMFFVVLFAFVGNERSGLTTEFSRTALTETTLQTLASVDFVTSRTIQALGDGSLGHRVLYGDTYVASLISLLPGPLVRALNNGSPLDTGAFYFRDLIHFHNANHGYSYATPAEAYLNFGLPGSIAVGLVFGLLLRYAWGRTEATPRTLRSVLYPTLLATLPYGLRSDALTHSKSVLYTLIIVGFFLLLARRSERPEIERHSPKARRPPPVPDPQRSHAMAPSADLSRKSYGHHDI